MCGIVGLWNRKNHPVSPALLTVMRDAMKDRGPDDAGLWVQGNIGFGHRRLSIIDLSPLGRQPMKDDETGAVITFNGEVFNFQEIRHELESLGARFRSKSDTEVILKAFQRWGKECVQRFVGMFAFAIWDPRDQVLFIARDRLGIKPLYYLIQPDLVMFASRMGALLKHPDCPRDIDEEALGLYLEVGFVPAPWSMVKNIRKLSPGHTLWIDRNGVQDECYWSPDRIEIDRTLFRASEDDLVERLDSLLTESVKLRLISDVPLGAFLSGGIDSSLVVALMSKVSSRPPKTFTVGFREKEYDESSYAEAIARHLGTEHHQKTMESGDLLTLIDENTRQYDEPFADWSSLPTMMVSKFAREHVTVSLSGDGGDELFAGYHYYPIVAGLQHAFLLPESVRHGLAYGLGLSRKHELMLLGQALEQRDLVASFAFMRSMLKDYGRKTLIDSSSMSLEKLFSRRSRHFPRLDAVAQATRLDVAYYLPDDILQKVDVASMTSSLEARVPLLDHRVVEFALSLPTKWKRRFGQSKILLKKVLEKYVPRALFERPKRGFCVPTKEWFRHELREMICDELSPARVKNFGYLHPEGVKRLLDLHLSGARDTQPMLWVLMSLLRWNTSFRCL